MAKRAKEKDVAGLYIVRALPGGVYAVVDRISGEILGMWFDRAGAVREAAGRNLGIEEFADDVSDDGEFQDVGGDLGIG